MRGILTFSLGSRLSLATSISLISGGKSTAHMVHLLAERLVDQVDHELAAVADVRRGVLQPAVRLAPAGRARASGGVSLNMLKNENGAAFTMPVGPSVVTSAIGRGITRLMSSL